ncbi:MAG: hypothetical protein JRJ85_19145, partial [Deltaproteobacteria bacterium]|nr:hypothetical protein [Deltaproteobacteria bacterium]
SLLAEVWNSSTVVQFAWGGALGMFASGIGRWMGGFFLLRLSPLLLGRGAILVLAFIFIGIFLIPAPLIILCLAVAATWFASINFGALFHLASESVSKNSQATVFGLVNFLANLGAILFTVLFGWIKDTFGSFEWGFAALTIWAFFSLFISRSLKKSDT